VSSCFSKDVFLAYLAPCGQLACEHLCITTQATTAQCVCFDGFNIAADQRHCIGNQSINQSINQYQLDVYILYSLIGK